MRPRKKDPSFLYMAAIAGTGGLMNILFAIGSAVWTSMHGRPYTPFFGLFAIWGIAALYGAYACLATYRLTDDPTPRPPPGGLRLELIKGAEPVPLPQIAPSERRAA
jgi:hypothetical protein